MTASKILLAEDSRSIASHIRRMLAANGAEVIVAEDGQAAWEVLESGLHRFDTLILDREMPRLNGIELLERIKASPRFGQIPVVMSTAADDEASIREGLARGAYYYLTKPFVPELLQSVVAAAIGQHRDYLALQESVREAQRLVDYLTAGEFCFRTIDEGRELANALARTCPEPEKVVLGLQELILNAVEHGNLGISYAEKSALLMNGSWHEEIERRLASPEGRRRRVSVSLRRTDEAIHFRIRDEGEGFDWKKYLDFDVDRAFDNHGRGIAMARHCSLDAVRYSGNGNTVTVTVNLVPSV